MSGETESTEEARLAALHGYAILDTGPERSFDRLTRLAAAICETPISLVSLIDERRQWFKSSVGIGAGETSRDIAFCHHAIQKAEIFEVEDATADDRFRHNPLVQSDPNIRFYAGQPLQDPDGYRLGTLCVIDREPRKLTEHQREALRLLAEEVMDQIVAHRDRRRLAKRESEFSYLYNNTPDMIQTVDMQGRLLEVNRAWLRNFGSGQKDYRGLDFADSVHPDSREYWNGLLESMRQGDFQLKERVRLTLVTPAGRTMDVEGPILLERPNVDAPMATCIFRDVSGETRVRRELEHAYDLLERTSEAARIGTWEVELESGRVTWSRVTRDIHEVDESFAPDLTTGINFYHEGESRETIARVFGLCAEQGRPYNVELQIVTARGRIRWVRAIGLPIKEHGKITRVYGLFQDIDEGKRSEEKLREANRRMSDLLASVSHEIRTPLNAIVGYPQLILDDIDTIERDEIAEYARIIFDRGQLLLSLLNDIIDLSRIEANEIALHRGPLDVHAFLGKVEAGMAALARSSELRLTVEVAPDTGAVHGDDLRLHQVLTNLISNAIKASSPGGRVAVKAWREDDRVSIAVSDEGRGIPRPEIARIFESFYRAGTYAGKDSGGTGLGLSIVKRIVDLHEGALTVDSEPDRGSTFRMTLPAHAALELESNRPVARDSKVKFDLSGTRILIVEDDELSRILLDRILTRHGIECTAAESGEDALDRALESFDLVFMDSQLPGIDGPETMRRMRILRERGQRPMVPIIALTANAMTDDPARYLQLGFDAYESKPLITDGLSERIAGYLRKAEGST